MLLVGLTDPCSREWVHFEGWISNGIILSNRVEEIGETFPENLAESTPENLTRAMRYRSSSTSHAVQFRGTLAHLQDQHFDSVTVG